MIALCGVVREAPRTTFASESIVNRNRLQESRFARSVLAREETNARPHDQLFKGADCRDREGIGIRGASGDSAIKSSWQGNTGQLTCRWSEAGQRVAYNVRWMGETWMFVARICPLLQISPATAHLGEPAGSNLTVRCATPNRSMDSIA